MVRRMTFTIVWLSRHELFFINLDNMQSLMQQGFMVALIVRAVR